MNGYSSALYIEGYRHACNYDDHPLRTSLADEAMKVLGAKSRTDAVRMVLQEIVEMRRFNAAMKKNSGKPKR